MKEMTSLKPELHKRLVKGPDGVEFEVEPLRDYYCEALPEVQRPAYLQIIEDLFNWARSESIWILGFGTGCGAIEMRPLMTPRFDAYRYGIQWRPTPRQANLFVISGYLSVKTLKRVIRSYEQMQNPKYVVGLGSCRSKVLRNAITTHSWAGVSVVCRRGRRFAAS